MPNIKSAKKRVVTQNASRAQNQSFKADMRSAVKRVENLVSENKKQEAEEALKSAAQKIDKAVGKGLIHKNNGNRKKARLSKKVQELTA
ncbi:30S ribosomal protein S20 [Pontibacillus marinus]|uniref:Small ribosomal subunit protein bS20 n=1 Tax=Pontibacillus marinus BH030004 = DSM 16465 TaxID=1385511 RepID=A0A0A5FY39_9BACI|nr:30S ribosomal protein S20 [Pontibacillus marinus]KGX83725.1 30S ribosomal protein S20 [Pontibacillus marinus BH030004 = DSM 16465]